MSTSVLQLQVETPTHGRALLRPAESDPPAGLLVGFHGYAETAAIQMTRLAAIPGAAAWTLLSVQALHRFYRGRSEDVVASWMTREDRELAMADNIRYVDAAIDAARGGPGRADPGRPVFAGFSQGVPMAYRAATRGRRSAAGVIAVGGEIPPELLEDAAVRFPPVLLVRGARDDWYSQATLDADVAALERRGVPVQSLVFDGAHEWGAEAGAWAGRFLATVQPS